MSEPKHSADPNRVDDEAFLDEVYDALTTAFVDGDVVDAEALAEGRLHLVPQIQSLIRIAADVSVVVPAGMPEIRGYEIVRELGRGGMGSVYLARQTSLAGRLVALKVMPHGTAISDVSRGRFRNEALSLARLRHPNVVEIFDVLDDESHPAYSMEWIDGRSLLEIISGLKEYPEGQDPRRVNDALEALVGAKMETSSAMETFARWGKDIASALAAVHDEGLLHRDVKPSNIMVRRVGTVVLTDFGLARDSDGPLHTRTGSFLGTPAYAAPEQLRAEPLDARSDVYGLGATLYHLATGRLPHPVGSQIEILQRIERDQVPSVRKVDSRVPQDLATIVETAMDVDPARRYASAAALAEDLERYLSGRPIVARPTTPALRVIKFVRRNRSALKASLAGGVVVLTIAILLAIYFVGQAAVPERVAEHVRTAQLILLDPKFPERIVTAQHGVRMDLADQPLGSAVREIDAALALRDDTKLRAMRASLLAGQAVLAKTDEFPSDLRPLAPRSFEMARDLWRGARRPAIDAIVELDRSIEIHSREKRCAGLIALICGYADEAIAAWRGLDLARITDPLVDTALGQLYLQRQQPALAWPRLERAFLHFYDVGFIGGALADAALRCGDSEHALRLIETVRTLESPPLYGALERIEADALYASGRVDEARVIFDAVSRRFGTPMTFDSLATFYEREGDLERALHCRARLAHRWPGVGGVFDGLARVLEKVWDAWTPAERERNLFESLEAPGNWLDEVAFANGRTKVAASLFERFRVDAYALRRLRASPKDLRRRQVAEWLASDDAKLLVASGPGTAPAVKRGVRYTVISSLHGVGDSRRPRISSDGRYVLFDSSARFDAEDDNETEDVFLFDRRDGSTRRLTDHEGGSRWASFSPNGRFVLYYGQEATNRSSCFVYDRETRVAKRISSEAQNVSREVRRWETPAASVGDDGKSALFQLAQRGTWRAPLALWHEGEAVRMILDGTKAPTNLAFFGHEASCVYASTLMDMASKTNVYTPSVSPIVYRHGEGWSALDLPHRFDYWAAACDMSPCGRYLAIHSRAHSFTTIDNVGWDNIFVLDLETNRIVRASETAAGVGPNAYCRLGVTNGAFTAWVSRATNLCGTRDAPRVPRVYLKDHSSGDLHVLEEEDVPPSEATMPDLSTDGRVVVFQRRSLEPGSRWEIVIAELD